MTGGYVLPPVEAIGETIITEEAEALALLITVVTPDTYTLPYHPREMPESSAGVGMTL